MNNQNKKQNKDTGLGDSILNQIEKDEIVPESKAHFMIRNVFFWGLFALSIVVGALAFAGTLFATMHAGWEYYEVTHDNMLTFLVTTLPYIWILLVIGMVIFGYYNLRHTKHGYKYPLVSIVAAAVALSVLGGGLINHYGMGYSVDNKMGKFLPLYTPALERVAEVWQHPEEGRLLGVMEEEEFKDSHGEYWHLEIGGIDKMEEKLLGSNTMVRLLGIASSTVGAFSVCRVLPGDLRMKNAQAEMRERRALFLEDGEREFKHERKMEELRNSKCEGMTIRPQLLQH